MIHDWTYHIAIGASETTCWYRFLVALRPGIPITTSISATSLELCFDIPISFPRKHKERNLCTYWKFPRIHERNINFSGTGTLKTWSIPETSASSVGLWTSFRWQLTYQVVCFNQLRHHKSPLNHQCFLVESTSIPVAWEVRGGVDLTAHGQRVLRNVSTSLHVSLSLYRHPGGSASGWGISISNNYPLVMTNSLPWKDPPVLLIGKPSISMGHLYHGYLKEPEGM